MALKCISRADSDKVLVSPVNSGYEAEVEVSFLWRIGCFVSSISSLMFHGFAVPQKGHGLELKRSCTEVE